ncbi:hypothetical protein EPI10_011246 [Gossypium australe]|uniref:Uncharacterized protein n=1 Tax=Gossypium australe TaxID=47621 RepID=A0A5B6W915_9ROSI|nr:hypothetical protein EPI10_011246 [Gossypium australe]
MGFRDLSKFSIALHGKLGWHLLMHPTLVGVPKCVTGLKLVFDLVKYMECLWAFRAKPQMEGRHE